MAVVVIDQNKINLDGAAMRAGVTRATYPRPLDFWQRFAPNWVDVTERPGGLIVMTARSGSARQHGALVGWLSGVHTLAGTWRRSDARRIRA